MKPSVIYQPTGAAAEYAELALNIYTACPHGCQYCYNRRWPAGNTWLENARHVTPRQDLLSKLEHDCKELAGDPREILLCLTCDPYPRADNDMTRQVLLMLERYNLRATVLTKGGMFAKRDFDILARNGWRFGTSLAFSSDSSRATWEPAATPITSRIQAMITAKTMDIPTWLSMEPVIYPWEALELLREIHTYADLIHIGKWNHDTRANDINWKSFLEGARQVAITYDLGDRITYKQALLTAAGE